MPEKRQNHREFWEVAVRLVNETGKRGDAGARELGIDEGTLGNCVALDLRARESTKGLNTGDVE